LPGALSTTSVLRLQADPDGYAADLARPMPRPPSRAARFGTRFHQWVERYFGPRLGSGGLGQQQLVDPDDLPDRVDAGNEDESDLRELCEAFAVGRFGASTPYAVEAPFSLLVAGRLVRGRIDAVYELPPEGPSAPRWQVIDWKTGRGDTADPLQLAIYRLAWAEVQQVPLDQVEAAFYHVRSDRLVRPGSLPDRRALEVLLAGPEEGDR
jgi:DNA helicase-2/ATP-dependent DNA helicase PcrA